MINFTNKPENLWQRPSTVFLDDFCFCQDGAKQRRNTGQRHQTGSEIWENRWRWKYDKYSGRYDRGMERRGRIIVGVEGFFGSATAVDKDLGIWVQLCFRDSTTTWWPTFFISSVKIKTRNSCWKLFPLFSHSSFISSVKIKMRNSFWKLFPTHIFINLKCSLPSKSERDPHGFIIYKKMHTRNSFPGSKALRLDTGEY